MRCILNMTIALVITLLINGCRNDDSDTEPDDDNQTPTPAESYIYQDLTLADGSLLVESELIQSYTTTALRFAISQTAYAEMDDLIEYPVDVYRLTYTTNSPTNGTIEASGLVCLPSNTTETFPGLSAHHGTIFRSDDAPSSYSTQNLDVSNNFELLASAGYVTFIPDYIGFGASSDLLHPYYNYAATVTAVVNFIKAGKELAKEVNVNVNDDLFIFGYSEGGYVSLATQQYIEQTKPDNISLKATAAGAGGYDLNHVTDLIIAEDTYDSPAYLAYIIYSYTLYSDDGASLNAFFQEPYADLIPDLFDDTNDGGTINSQLNHTLEELFQPDFLAELRSGDATALREYLSKNSIQALALDQPVRLYHGTADQIVPFADSQLFYETQQAFNAGNIELMPINGGTHGSSLEPMVKSVIAWFEDF